jgi:hypothetical protein
MQGNIGRSVRAETEYRRGPWFTISEQSLSVARKVAHSRLGASLVQAYQATHLPVNSSSFYVVRENVDDVEREIPAFDGFPFSR